MAGEAIKVLYVDDDLNNLISFKASFRRDFEVFLGNCAMEGLSILRRQDIDVVVSDQRMPGMRGTEFLKWVELRYPKVVRILVSGTLGFDEIAQEENIGHIYKCVAKPWNYEELAGVIKEGYVYYKTARGGAER